MTAVDTDHARATAAALEQQTTDAPLRLLVVDDDDVDRLAVRRGLQRAGVSATVDEAASAIEALARVGPAEYDCIFLDYNIPGGDGLTLLKGIRNAGITIPVVMLTGHGDEQVAVELMKAGAVDYLPKASLTPERLASSLRYAVELSRAAAARARAEEVLRENAERTRFLAEAGAVLGRSLDIHATMQDLARLAVPMLGDYGIIYLADAAGCPLAVAAVHRDPAGQPLAESLGRQQRPAVDHPTSGLAIAMRSGRTHVVDEMTDEYLRSVAGSAEALATFRALAPRASLFVPLVARGQILGAISFSLAESGRRYTAAQISLAEAVAERAAMALDNALLFEQAQRARADAEAANRAKGEFLARMSHDLRTPLNAIGGYAQLVEVGAYGDASEGQLDAMRRIRRAQEHLLTLINDILSFARLEAGQVRLEIETLRADDVLSRIRELVEPQVVAKGLRYESEGPGCDAALRADLDRLMQILLNLTSNALKFTESGAVTVGCTASERRVRLFVRDTGRGIPHDKLATVFDAFVQAGHSAEERNQGVGLGLAISRELARLMGGDLSVDSAVGKGSTFWVELPRAG